MVKIEIKVLRKLCNTLKENQLVIGSDGETGYTINIEGEYIIIKEDIRR